jgi:hypothetical protein
MAATPSLEHDVTVRLIVGDLLFARRILQGAIDRLGVPQSEIPLFAMLRYLSMYVYESHKALEAIEPELAEILVVDNADIIERSRHTVKLFDDTHDQFGRSSGVTSQLGSITQAHRAAFLDNTWFPPARVLETDLAVYRYRGRLVATTHAIAFHLGLPPEAIADNEAYGRTLMSIGEGVARYVNAFAGNLPWQGRSFMDRVDLGSVENVDIRSSNVYPAAFDAGLDDEATAALLIFQCSVNFLALMLAEESNPQSAEAVFKLNLVVLYHVLSSLAKFKVAFRPSLTVASLARLDVILNHATTAQLMDRSKAGLRNTLMHYRPRGAQIVAQLSLDQPLCGLVEAYYPTYDFDTMGKLVDEHVQFVGEQLDDWSGLP